MQDHASINVLIAGTYTPICQLALPPSSGQSLLRAAWGGAALGGLRALLWPDAPKALATLLYILLGWIALPFAREIGEGLGDIGVNLMVVGGVLYSVGAVAYATGWPDPFPRVFGFHEVFHAFVVAAGACHFAAVARLVRGLR